MRVSVISRPKSKFKGYSKLMLNIDVVCGYRGCYWLQFPALLDRCFTSGVVLQQSHEVRIFLPELYLLFNSCDPPDITSQLHES